MSTNNNNDAVALDKLPGAVVATDVGVHLRQNVVLLSGHRPLDIGRTTMALPVSEALRIAHAILGLLTDPAAVQDFGRATEARMQLAALKNRPLT